MNGYYSKLRLENLVCSSQWSIQENEADVSPNNKVFFSSNRGGGKILLSSLRLDDFASPKQRLALGNTGQR